jgi:hypothetical protein
MIRTIQKQALATVNHPESSTETYHIGIQTCGLQHFFLRDSMENRDPTKKGIRKLR